MNVPREHTKSSGERAPSPTVLHARARESGSELRKLLISLSTGAIAAFYLALTSRIDPPLTSSQQFTVILSILSFSVCILSGALQWQADVKRNYHWANALEAVAETQRKKHYNKRDAWLRMRNLSGTVLRAAFSLGVLGAAAYVVARVVGV